MNNRMIFALIGLLAVGVFGWLVHYGWTHRYGSPETFEIQEPGALTVPFRPTPLQLDPADVANEVWRDVPERDVKLMPQMSQQPWTTGLVPAVRVQVFHDGTDIYFRLAWQDDVPNRTLSVDSFADACAVAVPLDAAAPMQSIMMGFSSPVNVWHWQAHKGAQARQESQASPAAPADYVHPFEDQEVLPTSKIPSDAAVTDLLAGRAGSLTPKRCQAVHGQGHWDNGTWAVVFKRSLRTQDTEQDSQFAWGRCRASFAVWDGDQGDRGSRKSMSDWVILDIEAAAQVSPAEQGRSVGRGVRDVASVRPTRRVAMPLLASIGLSGGFAPTQPEPEPRLVNIMARRFSYTPSRISVHKGQRVTLRLESLDVTHGLYLDGYGVDIKARPGMVGKATFTADKPGRFTFRCSETCGEFHPYMVGFLEVTPNSRFALFAAATGVGFLVILAITLRGGRRERRL